MILFAVRFCQAVSRLPSPFSKPVSSHKALCSASASELFTTLEVLCNCLNTMQYNIIIVLSELASFAFLGKEVNFK